MAIAIIVTDRNVDMLKAQIHDKLNGRVPVLEVEEIPDPALIRMAVVWKHPEGSLGRFPNLQLVSSLGAGVEQLFAASDLPPAVRTCRIAGAGLAVSMSKYVLGAVLNINKRTFEHLANQRKSVWGNLDEPELHLRIGVMGLGALGLPLVHQLTGLGFPVIGYNRSMKVVPGIEVFTADVLSASEFAAKVNLLINLLPLTSETKGILNRDLFRKMSPGSFLINVARGAHLIEEDLLWAMENGIIRMAFLDVFRKEPLPAKHPFWTYPGIIITPHSASVTDQEEAAGIIAENYRRLLEGKALLHEVFRGRGY